MKQQKYQIEQIETGSLIPYARNAKKHDAAQVAKIAGSIREFGFNNPVLIDSENGIIAGHGRIMAAQKLGMESVPCLRLSHLTESQRKAYILADNRLAEIGGGWDEEMLKLELADLAALDVDLEAIGFGAEDLAELEMEDEAETSDADAEPQIDKAEELRAKWGVEPGQLWELGDHRLLCGDSTKKEDVERVMGGDVADLCFTSPPYGQQRDYTKESDCSDWNKLMNGVFANLPMTSDGQVLVNLGLIHSDGEWIPYWEKWIEWMRQQGWRRFGWYVWDQMHGLRGDWSGRFAPSHEFIFHFNKQAKKPIKWVESLHAGEKGGALRGKSGTIGDVSSEEIQTHKLPDSVWRIQRQKGGIDGHPAPFSVPLVVHAMKSWDGISYEPFSGSGTTIIACEQLGRKARAIEISPAYVAVAIQRWADATGKEPKRLA